jgi:hypothetical protein
MAPVSEDLGTVTASAETAVIVAELWLWNFSKLLLLHYNGADYISDYSASRLRYAVNRKAL